MWKKIKNSLYFEETPIFENAKSILQVKNDAFGGCFLSFKSEKAAEENVFSLGKVISAERFMSCFRQSAFFMHAECGSDLSTLKKETLCLLIKKTDNKYLLMLPIFDDFSSSFLQYGEDGLEVVSVTGCDDITVDTTTALYVAIGENPYELMQNAAISLKDRFKTFKLREEKTRPDMLNKLGWCTWNAFYFDVNEKDLLSGFGEFKENGVKLGYALIDDGWLSTTDTMPIGSRVLTSFEENREKFPSGFKSITEGAKNEYGINSIMVWHAVMGYWAGCGIEDLGIKDDVSMKYSSALQSGADDMNRQFFHHPVKPEKALEFYDSFHKYLSSNGIKGVKIDTQYVIEGTANKAGGRVKAMDTYHNALETSVHNNFHDNCLNCMSCSVDMLYRMKHTNMLRASDDYSPAHENSFSIITNCAYNTFWMHPIAFPDWDMFWSNNDYSFINAVSRVAGGSPVYVSDKLGDHGYDLLKLLYVNDGEVLRPEEPGRPTLDCLMYNPVSDNTVLKVFNKNKTAYIIGAMNFKKNELEFLLSPADVDGALDTDYIVFGFKNREIIRLSKNESVNMILSGEDADLYTISPIVNGAAVIGLENKLNPSAAVTEFDFADGAIKASVLSGGEYKFWCEKTVDSVIINGKSVSFEINGNIIKINI